MSPPTVAFEAPGSGAWSLDTVHFPRPATAFVIELFPEPAARGFAEATARYGLLMDRIEWAFVHRWGYLRPSPVQPLPAGAGRDEWDLLVGSSQALQGRLASSERVFVERRWREDLERWDRVTKPAMLASHRKLLAVAPEKLDPAGLLVHLEECRENLRGAIYEHHRLNVAPVIPVGDFLVHARDWTGRSAARLLALTHGAGDGAAGGSEVRGLADVIRHDSEAEALVRGTEQDAGAALASLASLPAPVGGAVREFIDLVGWRTAGSGFDIAEPCLVEMPSLLLETIRVAVRRSQPRERQADDQESAEVRAAVPGASRRAFDELLGEARASHRVRDERAIYCDVWAYGLARRAVLAASRRLVSSGVIEEPEDLLECSYEELGSLIGGAGGPLPGELRTRAGYRGDAREEEAPVVLGGSQTQPVPLEWLSAGARRTERAFRAYVAAMSGDERQGGAAFVSGMAASPGRHEGRARVVRGTADLARLRDGDILVTPATSPALIPVLPLLGAIVTDRGGVLSHAAIVAREFGIPAVVGTADATARIPDGAFVRVDGAAGQIAVLPEPDSG